MSDVVLTTRLQSLETAAPLVLAAHDLAARLPALLSAARRLAATQLHGVHSRRRAGPGEDFWQYRRYSFGEAASSIDWRRSARGDHTFVREKEWQATHGFWFWVDLSSSMRIRSKLSEHTKSDAAMIALFALADRLVGMNERTGLLGLTPALSIRNIATRLAESLVFSQAGDGLPPLLAAPRFSDCVLFSDFFEDTDALMARCSHIASNGAHLHLVQILDPVEESFPFTGRIQFVDPETNEEFTAGRAEVYARRFKWALEGLKTRLRNEARSRGWTYQIYHTGKALSALALPLLFTLTQLTPSTALLARELR